MTLKSAENPFKVGDVVVYRPSERGWGYEVMSPLAERLVPGGQYVVAEIQRGDYIVVEGYKHPGGGLHWTEFERKI
jgi:hypothetical protein